MNKIKIVLLFLIIVLSACASSRSQKGGDYYFSGFKDFQKPLGEVYEGILIVLNKQAYVVVDYYYPFQLRARVPKNFLRQYVFTDKEELYLELNLTQLSNATRVTADVMRISTEEPDMSEKIKSERVKENSLLINNFFEELKTALP